jgi:hypothetical protein
MGSPSIVYRPARTLPKNDAPHNAPFARRRIFLVNAPSVAQEILSFFILFGRSKAEQSGLEE